MDIDEDKTFYTATMARVYADQGRYARAARIYGYLLDQTPDRMDLKQALDDVLSKLPGAAAQWEEVSNVIARWVRLMLRCKALRQIERIRISRDHLGQ